MKPVIQSYTDPITNSANTTINDGSAFLSKILNMELVPEADANYTKTGDGQEPVLTSIISKGTSIILQFTCLQGNVGDGYDLLAAMFNKYDTRQKTLVVLDADDSNRAYSATCRNKGVGKPNGKIVQVKIALVSEYILCATTTETTWTNASSGTKTININKGNVSALPVFDLTPSAANTNGNKFRRFATIYNYTRKSAINYPIDITNGGLDTASLITVAGVTFTVNAFNNSVTSLTYTATAGSFPSIFPYLIYNNATGEQMRVTARTGTGSGTLTVVRGVNGSTAQAGSGTLNYSKMAYDGRDIRVYVGSGSGSGVETPYWFGGAQGAAGGMNTAATKIWIPYNVLYRQLGTLRASISDSDTSLTLSSTEGNIPPTNGLLLLGDLYTNEIASYDTYDVATGIFSGLSRGAKGSTAASATLGITVRAINEIWLYYGNASATAPSYSTANKPVFALTSTNDIWTFTSFASLANNTSFEWKSTQVGATDLIYTADASGVGPPFVQPTPADPNTIIGISLIGVGHSAEWYLTIPFGMTSATSSTTMKRENMPANQAFLRVMNGTAIISQTAIATQANSWSASTALSITASGYKLSLYAKNNTTTPYARRAAVQIDTMAVTMSNVNSADEGRPYVALGAEQTIDFDMDVTITNTTTGDALRITRPDVPVGAVIRVNTLLKTVTFLSDNSNAFTNLQRYSVRAEWLQLLQGNNVLSCDQAGIDIIPSWQGRNNSFG